jgi:hypothetical protein
MSQKQKLRPPGQKRLCIVSAVRKGASPRSVAKKFQVSLRTVQVWVSRAAKQRLDRANWSNRPRGGRRDKQATAARTEDMANSERGQSMTNSSGEVSCRCQPCGRSGGSWFAAVCSMVASVSAVRLRRRVGICRGLQLARPSWRVSTSWRDWSSVVGSTS